MEVRLKTKEIDVGASKMSKSKPESAVFIHDTDAQVQEKFKKAYCPAKVTEGNPVLDFARFVVFSNGNTLHVERPAKFGGDVAFDDYNALEKAFSEGSLHPADLKTAVGNSVNRIIEPVRKHFEKKKELLEVYKNVKITR